MDPNHSQYKNELMKLDYQNQLLACAVEQATKDWSEKDKENLANKCFKIVSIDRFNEKGRYPQMSMQIKSK